MLTALMVIACTFILGGLLVVVLCMEQTLADNPGNDEEAI